MKNATAETRLRYLEQAMIMAFVVLTTATALAYLYFDTPTAFTALACAMAAILTQSVFKTIRYSLTDPGRRGRFPLGQATVAALSLTTITIILAQTIAQK